MSHEIYTQHIYTALPGMFQRLPPRELSWGFQSSLPGTALFSLESSCHIHGLRQRCQRPLLLHSKWEMMATDPASWPSWRWLWDSPHHLCVLPEWIPVADCDHNTDEHTWSSLCILQTHFSDLSQPPGIISNINLMHPKLFWGNSN